MAAKKSSSSTDKQLKKAVKKLEVKLERADAEAAKWKKRAQQQAAAAASSEKRISKLETKLAKAKAKAKAAKRSDASSEDVPAAHVQSAVTEESLPAPDATWTVVQLRAEARARGLTGMSRKTKAEVLAALT